MTKKEKIILAVVLLYGLIGLSLSIYFIVKNPGVSFTYDERKP